MKKLLALSLALFCALSLAGCLAPADQPEPSPSGGADAAPETTVSWVGYSGDFQLYAKALNSDQMAISSVQHLPIYRLDTAEDFAQFQLDFGAFLSLDASYDEMPSFQEATAPYDDAFFAENTLMAIYVPADSGSWRYGVDQVFCDGTSFCVHVKRTDSADVGTADMAGWLVTVAVQDSAIAGCTEFDADLDNLPE